MREASGKRALLTMHHSFDRVLTMMHISNPGIGEVEEGGSGIPVTLGYIVSPRSPWASSESGNR